jgi:hypothetical protein
MGDTLLAGAGRIVDLKNLRLPITRDRHEAPGNI